MVLLWCGVRVVCNNNPPAYGGTFKNRALEFLLKAHWCCYGAVKEWCATTLRHYDTTTLLVGLRCSVTNALVKVLFGAYGRIYEDPACVGRESWASRGGLRNG